MNCVRPEMDLKTPSTNWRDLRPMFTGFRPLMPSASAPVDAGLFPAALALASRTRRAVPATVNSSSSSACAGARSSSSAADATTRAPRRARRDDAEEDTESAARAGAAPRPARVAPAPDTTDFAMGREPATALARAASAAVADGAGAIVAGMFGVMSALERACLDAGRFARGHARGKVEAV